MNRTKFIGGSDIASILGISPWKTALDLYHEKIGNTEEIEQTEPMRWGKKLESPILSEYKERHAGSDVTASPEIVHPKYRYMVGHLDAFNNTEDVVVEIKNISRTAKQWANDSIPTYYRCQVAYYCALTQRDTAHVAILFHGSQYKELLYESDKEWEENLLMEVEKFWWHVQNRKPPAASTISDIINHGNVEDGKSIEIDDFDEKIVNLKNMIDKKNSIEEEINNIKSEIQFEMGDATEATFQGSTIATWRERKCNRLDTKKYKKSNPDLYQQFCKENSTRVFRLSL